MTDDYFVAAGEFDKPPEPQCHGLSTPIDENVICLVWHEMRRDERTDGHCVRAGRRKCCEPHKFIGVRGRDLPEMGV